MWVREKALEAPKRSSKLWLNGSFWAYFILRVKRGRKGEWNENKKWLRFIVCWVEMNCTSQIIDNEKLRGSNSFDNRASKFWHCTMYRTFMYSECKCKTKKSNTRIQMLREWESERENDRSKRENKRRYILTPVESKQRAKYLFMQIDNNFSEWNKFMSIEQHTSMLELC